MITVVQWCSNLAREILFPAEFSSNPDQTHLPILICHTWGGWLSEVLTNTDLDRFVNNIWEK